MGKKYFIVAQRGRYKNGNIETYQNLEPRFDGISNTLTTVLKDNYVMEVSDMGEKRIRKLTPTECYKLMGFDAEDCKKASEGGISNSQLYRQAGNSIVVNVLEAIFTELGKIYEEFRIVNRVEEVSRYERRRQKCLKADDPCLAARCAWNDSDLGCTCPTGEEWYQCPLEPDPDWDAIMSESEGRDGTE